jgi:hypothetical protein
MIKTSIISLSKEELMEQARALGAEYERRAHYCPQATLAALMDALHFRDDTLFRSSFGFHGGGGDTNDGACGGLIAGTMAVSYFFGRTRSEFDLCVSNCHATGLVKKLHDLFETEFGGIRCRDVHKKLFGREFNVWEPNDLNSFLDMGAHEKQCPETVGKAAAWTVGIIWDEMHREERIRRRHPDSY